MKIDRRLFLRSSGLVLAGVGTRLAVPGALARAAAQPTDGRRVLVVVFLRGAADALNVVVPHGEKAYYKLRPDVAIPRPGQGGARGSRDEGALDLDGFFGLHPALGPLMPLWRERELAVVTAAGSPDRTRSHFDAQDYMESGTPGVKSTRDGWLNRYLQGHADDHTTGLRAVALTQDLPRMLSGAAPALSIPDLGRFGIGEDGRARVARHGLEEIYRLSGDELLAATAKETFDAVDLLRGADEQNDGPQNGATYPRGPLGRGLEQLASLIRSDVGLEIGYTESGGWDTHVGQGRSQGALANRLRELGEGLAAFRRDLGDLAEHVTVVTLSEFGRTAAQNGTGGTDHGHAGSIFVLGGGVHGGRVHGDWPGLEPEQLHEGRDLALTTDFRDVLAELLTDRLGAEKLAAVFPSHPIKRRLDLVT